MSSPEVNERSGIGFVQARAGGSNEEFPQGGARQEKDGGESEVKRDSGMYLLDNEGSKRETQTTQKKKRMRETESDATCDTGREEEAVSPQGE